jgi:hypothetical protein
MRGRVLRELLRAGPAPDSIPVERTVHRVQTSTANGRYELELQNVRVGTTEYIEQTRTTR